MAALRNPIGLTTNAAPMLNAFIPNKPQYEELNRDDAEISRNGRKMYTFKDLTTTTYGGKTEARTQVSCKIKAFKP